MHGAIHGGQQAPFSPPAAQGAVDLERAPASVVDLDGAIADLPPDGGEVGQGGLLGLFQVGDDGPGRP